MKFSFLHQRHALSTSFDLFVVTYWVTNSLLKLIHILLFSTEKTEFPFELPYFRVLPICCLNSMWISENLHNHELYLQWELKSQEQRVRHLRNLWKRYIHAPNSTLSHTGMQVGSDTWAEQQRTCLLCLCPCVCLLTQRFRKTNIPWLYSGSVAQVNLFPLPARFTSTCQGPTFNNLLLASSSQFLLAFSTSLSFSLHPNKRPQHLESIPFAFPVHSIWRATSFSLKMTSGLPRLQPAG